MTQVSIPSSKLIVYTKLTLILLLTVGLGFFTYFITMILNVFFTTPHLRDHARYVLFVYMLMNDTFFLFLGFSLMLNSVYELYVPVPLCYVLYTLSSVTFRVTPYNLAAMALEQYVAICHPLRHVELCTAYRAHVTFTMICFLLSISYVVELYIMLSSKTNIFSRYIICRQNLLIVNPIQNIIFSINFILCFTLVGIVILVTYIKIVLVAHRISSQSSSASKAGKTVILHAFQLLLSMASLLSTLTESFLIKKSELLPIANFLAFTCLPRFLSPMIYGIRDEALRKHMKRFLPHFLNNNFGKN
ncbi:odorant receptor 131-2-like [Bufo bufo]|uniref:odorant receptor 131-2-like n=1 Tax=Bufo bufo TaxID=8384 RepID=UPI001ABECFB6|nr:odorant receptor 131-2-like [Bufo bufo]